MKQRITVEQLQELTEEQKQRLRKWWKPEPGDFYYRVTREGKIDYLLFTYSEVDKQIYNHKEFKIPALSIGQMIELLGEDWINKIYSVDYDHNIYLLYDGEFADALWAEVKEVL